MTRQTRFETLAQYDARCRNFFPPNIRAALCWALGRQTDGNPVCPNKGAIMDFEQGSVCHTHARLAGYRAPSFQNLTITCTWTSTTAPLQLDKELLRAALKNFVIDLVDEDAGKISIYLTLATDVPTDKNHCCNCATAPCSCPVSCQYEGGL